MKFIFFALATGLVSVAPPVLGQQLDLNTPAAEMPQTEPVQPKLAKGLLLMHEGRAFFSPCRDRSYLKIEDVSANGAVLSALQEFGLGSGRNLYVELVAVEQGGLLEVSAINFAHTTARCLGSASNKEQWRAVGLDADWEAAAGVGSLRVEQRDRPELRTSYGALKSEGGQHLIEATGAVLAIAPGMCRIADGTTLTGWRATLNLDGGEVLEGCAWER